METFQLLYNWDKPHTLVLFKRQNWNWDRASAQDDTTAPSKKRGAKKIRNNKWEKHLIGNMNSVMSQRLFACTNSVLNQQHIQLQSH